MVNSGRGAAVGLGEEAVMGFTFMKINEGAVRRRLPLPGHAGAQLQAGSRALRAARLAREEAL